MELGVERPKEETEEVDMEVVQIQEGLHNAGELSKKKETKWLLTIQELWTSIKVPPPSIWNPSQKHQVNFSGLKLVHFSFFSNAEGQSGK